MLNSEFLKHFPGLEPYYYSQVGGRIAASLHEFSVSRLLHENSNHEFSQAKLYFVDNKGWISRISATKENTLLFEIIKPSLPEDRKYNHIILSKSLADSQVIMHTTAFRFDEDSSTCLPVEIVLVSKAIDNSKSLKPSRFDVDAKLFDIYARA